jgi:hypothetical protein
MHSAIENVGLTFGTIGPSSARVYAVDHPRKTDLFPVVLNSLTQHVRSDPPALASRAGHTIWLRFCRGLPFYLTKTTRHGDGARGERQLTRAL